MLRKIIRSALISAVIASFACLLLGITFSWSYWGYPFVAPSFDEWVEQYVRVDSFQEFGPPWRDSKVPDFGIRAVVNASALYEEGGTDFEVAKLAFELKRAGKLPTTNRRIGIEVFSRVCRELDSAGVLYEGEPGYRNAKQLYGALALGWDAAGREIIIASLGGSEASNDHYPRYQALFEINENQPKLVSWQRYFVDIAGIEGATWWLMAFGAAIFVVPAVAILAAATTFAIQFRRRRSLQVP